MTKLLITLVAAVALTHAGNARDFAFFHGDIGLDASPVVSAAAPANKVTARAAAKRDVVAKRKSAPKASVAITKPKAARERVTAR
jgi:hypothetical protein